MQSDLRSNADTIGFVVPIIFGGIPRIASDFITQLQIENPTAYIFAVITHGDKNGYGIGFHQIDKLLNRAGHKLSSSFSVQMPHNAPFKDHARTLKNKETLYEQEARTVIQIGEAVKNQTSLPYKRKNSFMRFINGINYATMTKPTFDKRFQLTEACTGCGICARICPTENITLNLQNKPEWESHSCQACFACLQWCPKIAIEYTKATVGVERYHHPNVKMRELL